MKSEKRISIVNSEKSIDEVVADMFLFVIENEVRSKPYISVISKRMMYWGNGPHFKAGAEYIKSGLMKNMGIRIPKKSEVERARYHYGYEALQYPWSELNSVVNRVMRNKIQKNLLNGKGLNDVRVMLGRGYIKEDGTLDPNQTMGISVYVIFLADRDYRDHQNSWISDQPEWVRFQIARNQETHYDILFEKKKQASTLVIMNRKLIKQEEYKQLEPAVDRARLPWGFDD